MKTQRGTGDGPSHSRETEKKREQLKALAWLLDSSIRLPGGFRIGLDAILGLVPFLGDAAGVLLSGYIVSQAARLGAPRSVLLRMMLNVAVEGVVGLIPLVGDLFDAGWKANMRNVQLLSRHFENPSDTARSSRRVVGLILAALILFMALLGAISALLLNWIWNALGG